MVLLKTYLKIFLMHIFVKVIYLFSGRKEHTFIKQLTCTEEIFIRRKKVAQGWFLGESVSKCNLVLCLWYYSISKKWLNKYKRYKISIILNVLPCMCQLIDSIAVAVVVVCGL